MKTIYKKYLKPLWLLSLLGVITFGTFLSSCKEDDPVSDETMLFSYGPMPVARGAELRFIGNRLDKVTSIVIPPAIEISSSEFTEQTESSIKLTVPQTAEEGFVQLNSSDGSITTKTQIGYSEPIDIDDSFSPKTIKPGAVLTIDGDYLNLVGEVIFTDRISVDSANFITQSRKQITLTVPAEAQSGKIAVSNGAEDPIIVYSEDELTVVTPSITGLNPLAIKAGSNLTITGNDLDLVSAIEFQGGTVAKAADFSSQSASSIVVAAPSNIMDGTITLVVPSGVTTVSSESLTAVVPTNVAVTAESRYKAGLNAIITGTDIDLVTSVLFSGSSDITEFTNAGGTLTVTIPDNAIDGVIILNLASGKTVETSAITLVKPAATALNPNPVGAGSQMVITGTDLDLVLSLTYGGGIEVEVTPDSETSITTMVPVDATSGAVALNLANGTSINTASLTINTPEFCFIPVLPNTEEVEIKAGSVLVVEVANSDVLTDVIIANVSTQYIVEGSKLHMFIPDNAGGMTDFNLVSSTGEITYQIDVIPAGFVETTIFTGPVSITWSDGGRAMVPISAFENAPVGSIMKLYFSQVPEWGQIQINNGSWAPIPFAELNNDGYIKTGMIDKAVSEFEIVLTQDVLNNIKTNTDGTWGIIIQGQNWIMNKISIIVITPTAETIWEGNINMGNWAGFLQLPKDLWGKAAIGKKLKLTYSLDPAGTYWQIMLKNWSWGDVKKIDLEAGSTSVEVEITQDILDLMMADGIILQGANYTITKVELE